MKNSELTKIVEMEGEAIFDIDDVIEFITDYATDDEIKQIKNCFIQNGDELPLTLYDEMKRELMVKAMKKYSLEKLEEKLGTKHELTIGIIKK